MSPALADGFFTTARLEKSLEHLHHSRKFSQVCFRDWVEREVGGGIGMGNTCKPLAVSFQCMTKSTTNKKKKKKKIYYLFLFLAMLGLHCCVSFSLVVASKGFSVAVYRLLIVKFLLFQSMRLQGTQVSVAAVPWL